MYLYNQENMILNFVEPVVHLLKFNTKKFNMSAGN